MPLHRQVFFIGGFDPKTPRYYHRLFRAAARLHPATELDETIEVGLRIADNPFLDHWDVRWLEPERPALVTRYSVMRWDDVVRRHWPRNLLRAARDYWHVYVLAGSQGMLKRVWGAARAAFWLSVFPLGVSLGLLVLTAGQAWAAAAVGGLPASLAAASGLLLWLGLWRGIESRIDSEWLLRLYGFTWAQAHGRLDDLERRLDELAAELVRQAEASTARELLLVGHSTGAILAISVMARALRQAPWLGSRGPQLGLLTLGHCIPILAWLRAAREFRAEVAALADHPALVWWDYSAPADWAAFAAVPPWLAVGRARVHQSSPRFHQILDEASYQALLANRHALHMQYLSSPTLAGGYDPLVLTAGRQTLAERHAALKARTKPRHD